MKMKVLTACVLVLVLSGVLGVGVASALYRSGWSNIWFDQNHSWWFAAGTYQSASDLLEDSIEVHGTLCRNGSQVGSCSEWGHNLSSVGCWTGWVNDPSGDQVWLASGSHRFHTYGYVDSSFSSWQQTVH